MEKVMGCTCRRWTWVRINITEEQLDELRANIDNINFDEARKIEKEVRHDVMSHVKAYGLQCEKAKGIIHLEQHLHMLEIIQMLYKWMKL